jgi:hypothetical protein
MTKILISFSDAHRGRMMINSIFFCDTDHKKPDKGEKVDLLISKPVLKSGVEV